MANFMSIAAAGRSLERLLNACFREHEPISDTRRSTAALVTTEDFERSEGSSLPTRGISIFLYRVDFNRATRAAWSAVGSVDGRAHLPLDMHFLLTAWGDNAEYEHRILGRAMQCLETTPILSGPLLEGSAAWAPNEAVQVVLGEITTEEVMRTFDSLPIEYKLSVPYVARVVRIDSRKAVPIPEVTTAITGVIPSDP